MWRAREGKRSAHVGCGPPESWCHNRREGAELQVEVATSSTDAAMYRVETPKGKLCSPSAAANRDGTPKGKLCSPSIIPTRRQQPRGCIGFEFGDTVDLTADLEHQQGQDLHATKRRQQPRGEHGDDNTVCFTRCDQGRAEQEKEGSPESLPDKRDEGMAAVRARSLAEQAD